MNTKKAGKLGGKAAAAKLTPEQRTERARKGGLARKKQLGKSGFAKIGREGGRRPKKRRK